MRDEIQAKYCKCVNSFWFLLLVQKFGIFCSSLNGSNLILKARLRVGDSSWSEKFSLDAVGDIGQLACKDKRTERKYEVSLIHSI